MITESRKDAPSVVPQTSEEELQRILAEQAVEQDWWQNYPTMEGQEDIQKAITSGRATVVPSEGVGYKISARVPENFRVLELYTKALLDQTAQLWLRKLSAKEISDPKLFLVVSSLGRTTEYQKQLREQGYPTAENSTHTKLGAFDIAVNWFKQNRPELLDALDEALNELKTEHEFNWILEPEIGAYYIASNPEVESKRQSIAA